MSNPKRHHYLPQFYLKNFCNIEGGLWVYNDKDQSIKNLKPDNTTLIKNYYTIENEDGSLNYELEKRFSIIESETALVIDKINRQEDISQEEKGTLSLFIALQQNRTPAAVDLIHEMIDPMLEFMKKHYINAGVFDKFIEEYEQQHGLSKEKQMELLKKSKIELTKTGEWQHLINSAVEMSYYYASMKWELFYIQKSSLITSDNPLIMYDPKIDTGPYGFGIATPTVDKIFPIASNIILKMGDVGDKNIYYGNFNKKQSIRYVNASIFVRRKQFVISKNKELLEFLLKRTNNYKRSVNIKIN